MCAVHMNPKALQYTSFKLSTNIAKEFEKKKKRTEYKFELKLSLTSNAINII